MKGIMKIQDRIKFLKKHLAESERILKKFPDAFWRHTNHGFCSNSLFLTKKHIVDFTLNRPNEKSKYDIGGSYYHSKLVNKYIEKAFICAGYDFEKPGLFIIPFYEWNDENIIFSFLETSQYVYGDYFYFNFDKCGVNLKKIVFSTLKDNNFSDSFIFDLWSKIETNLK